MNPAKTQSIFKVATIQKQTLIQAVRQFNQISQEGGKISSDIKTLIPAPTPVTN